MKHIVILSAFLSPLRSGAEACAEEVPLALASRFKFTIVTARMRRDLPRRDQLKDQIPIIRIGIGSRIDKWLFPFLAPFVVHLLKPDVVHAVLETFAGLALMLSRAPKKILTCQTTNRSFLKGPIIRSPDHVTVISSVLKDICHRLGRTDIIHIPNGINVPAFSDAKTKVQKEQGTILFVGRLEKWKGVDTALKAFKFCLDEFKITNLKFKIIGDGSQRKALEKLSQELGIQDHVTLKGYLPSGEIEKEYARAEVFVGLSRSEALGNVFLEAQAARCAVIGSTVGGIPDILEQERTGLLVPPNDPASAASAMVKLFSDEKLRERIAEAGMQHALQFDWKEIAAKYAKLY